MISVQFLRGPNPGGGPRGWSGDSQEREREGEAIREPDQQEDTRRRPAWKREAGGDDSHHPGEQGCGLDQVHTVESQECRD